MKSEDGTGGRRPVLGDVGMSPHLFHFLSEQIASAICFFILQIQKTKRM